MKKFFSTLIVLAVITTAAVAETKLFSVNFAVPFDTLNNKVEVSSNVPGYSGSGSTKVNFTSIGFGVSGVNMFNNLIGLYTDVEFGLTQSIKSDAGKFTRKEYLGNDGKQFAMNFMIGPAFKILENDKMFFSAAPAFHWFMDYISFGGTNAISGGLIGLGANASFSYFFTDLIGITAGLDFAFDFLGYGDFRKDEDSQRSGGYYITATSKWTHINFTPKVGLTFRF